MKSSEMWVSVLAGVVASFLAYKGVDPTAIAAGISPFMAYALSRGVAKINGNG
jgi:uncharacterized membrane protein (DUF441 family)